MLLSLSSISSVDVFTVQFAVLTLLWTEPSKCIQMYLKLQMCFVVFIHTLAMRAFASTHAETCSCQKQVLLKWRLNNATEIKLWQCKFSLHSADTLLVCQQVGAVNVDTVFNAQMCILEKQKKSLLKCSELANQDLISVFCCLPACCLSDCWVIASVCKMWLCYSTVGVTKSQYAEDVSKSVCVWFKQNAAVGHRKESS